MILNICSIYVILYLCNRTESGCDFPIVRCPLVLQRRVMPMNTMEVIEGKSEFSPPTYFLNRLYTKRD